MVRSASHAGPLERRPDRIERDVELDALTGEVLGQLLGGDRRASAPLPRRRRSHARAHRRDGLVDTA